MPDDPAPTRASKDATRTVQATHDPTPGAGLGLGIEQHATWSLPDAATGADYALARRPDTFYTRWGNPTVQRLEAAVAALEGTETALAMGSGMGAIASAVIHHARGRKHIVSQRSLYAATAEVFVRLLPDFGVDTTFVAGADTGAFADAIRKDTAFVYLETPSNPLMELSDIRAIADLAADTRPDGVPVLVDNTFASPLNQRPCDLGATLSLHSATKYLGGHSDVVAGVLAGPEEAVAGCWETYKMLGPSLAPNDAFLVHRGIKTLALRIRAHNENAVRVASFLDDHPDVAHVHYPGLASHPQHDLARRQMPGGFGGMLSFELTGGLETGRKMIESTRLAVLGVSLGGVETLIQHPATMTHGPLNAKERRAAGISDGLIRLSVGIEDADDIIADLDQAIARATT